MIFNDVMMISTIRNRKISLVKIETLTDTANILEELDENRLRSLWVYYTFPPQYFKESHIQKHG